MSKVNQPTDAEKIKFGTVIRKQRKKKGYTQQQLADLLGITTKSVSCIERGFCFPAPGNIFKVARILDFSLDEFLFGFSRYNPDVDVPEINNMLKQLNQQQKTAAISVLEAVCRNFETMSQ